MSDTQINQYGYVLDDENGPRRHEVWLCDLCHDTDAPPHTHWLGVQQHDGDMCERCGILTKAES